MRISELACGGAFYHKHCAFTYVQRQGAAFSRNDIHVNSNNNTYRGHFPSVVVSHFVGYADRFISNFQHGRANGDEIASAQLTFVLEMLLNGGHPSPFLAAA